MLHMQLNYLPQIMTITSFLLGLPHKVKDWHSAVESDHYTHVLNLPVILASIRL